MFYRETSDGDPFLGRDGGPGVPPDALGGGRPTVRRGRARWTRDGRRGAGHGPAPRRAGSGDVTPTPTPAIPVRLPGRRSGRPDRVPGARRDPRSRRRAPLDRAGRARAGNERQDDPRPPARRGGPGGGLDRRLRGPRPQPRPGRGGRPRGPARVARRPRAGFAGRGAGDGRRADRGSLGRSPHRRPAGRTGQPRPAGTRTTGTPPVRRPGDRTTLRTGRRPTATVGRGSARSARGARPAGRRPPRRPRAGRPVGSDLERDRRVGRPPARARPTGLDPARPGRRRPVDGGGRRPEPGRPAGEAGGAPDPLRGGWRSRRLPPPRPAPHRRPHHPPATDRRSCDSSTSSGRISRSGSPRARATADRSSGSFPTGPLVLGGQPWTDGTVLDASPAARELGVRRGMALGSAHRLAPEATFLDPDLAADTAAVERALEALAAFSPGIAGATDPADPAFGLLEVQIDGLDRLWGPEPVLVERLARGPRPGPAGSAPDRHRRDPLRGDDRGRRGGGARPTLDRRAGRRGGVPGPAPGGAPHPRPGRPCPAGEVRAAPDRGGGPAAPLGARRPVRGGGGAGPRPGERAGDRTVPPAPGSRAARPRAGARAADRGPRAAPVRPPPAGRRAGRPAHGPRGGRRPGRAPGRPRSCLRPARDPDRPGDRAALPRADRRGRGDRAAPPRPARAGAPAGRRSPGSSWSWPRSLRRPASSSPCSSPRPPGRPGSAGSSPGSPSPSARIGSGGSS